MFVATKTRRVLSNTIKIVFVAVGRVFHLVVNPNMEALEDTCTKTSAKGPDNVNWQYFPVLQRLILDYV